MYVDAQAGFRPVWAQGDCLSFLFTMYINTNVKGPPMHRYTHVKSKRSPLMILF